MSELKTKETNKSVREFLESVEVESKRKDSFELLSIFETVTAEKPVMWGTSIVGFGKYHYKSDRSSQAGDWFLVGFSPRKQNLALYVMASNPEIKDLLLKLGKHKVSGSCLHINRLSDIDLDVLGQIVKTSFKYMQKITC